MPDSAGHRQAGIAHTLVAAASLVATAACGNAAGPGASSDVLVIGNSLVFGLADALTTIAESEGRSLETESAALGGTALIDHVTGGNAQDWLDRGSWGAGILSQGPTWHAVCRDTLVLAAELLEDPIRVAGGRPALLMTWPGVADPANGNWDRVRASFHTAARAVDGIFIPAGEAWRAAWRAEPALQLHGSDGYHPTPLGTFLAALTAYERLAGRDARALPAAWLAGWLSVPEATIRFLLEAAHAANQQFGDGAVDGPSGHSDQRPLHRLTHLR